MSFGTIALWTESGRYEEYEITKPTTSIGRQPGNDIVLNTTAVSRYHAQLELTDEQLYLIDQGTVNGTFINDELIQSETRVALNEGDRIAIGDVLMVYIPPTATRRTSRILPSAVDIRQEGVPFEIVLDEPHQDVAPGARLNLSLIIKNTGETEEIYDITIGGMEQDWVKLNWLELTLGPTQEAEVQVSVRPPRASTTRPDRYPLTVRVTLRNHPDVFLEGLRYINVVGYSGLAMDIRHEEEDDYRLAVQNQGNVPLGLQLGGFSPEDILGFKFDPPRLSLQPGEAKPVDVEVKHRRGALRPDTDEVMFAVVARSLDSAGYQAPLAARYEIPSPAANWFREWGLLVLGTIALLGILVVTLLAIGVISLSTLIGNETAAEEATSAPATDDTEATVGPSPTPAAATPVAGISSFSASPAAITYRTTDEIILTWNVDGIESADDVVIIGPLGNELTLTADNISSSSYTIDAAQVEPPTIPGEATYTLRVTGADGQAVNSRATVTFDIAECEAVEDSEGIVRSAPNLTAEELTRIQAGQDVIIRGRTEDTLWLFVRTIDETDGWIEVASIECESDDAPEFDDYVVADTVVQPLEELEPTGEESSDTGG